MMATMALHPHFSAPTSVWTLAPAGMATLAYLLAAFSTQRAGQARTSLYTAWGLHLLSLVAGVFNTPAHFGFAPALSITAWLMLTMYLVEQQLYPRMRAASLLAVMGAVAVLLALFFPGTALANGRSVLLRFVF